MKRNEKRMRGSRLAVWLLASIAAVCWPSISRAQDPGLTIYPAPNGATANTQFAVQVRKEGGVWQDIFVYDESVNPGYEQHTGYIYFDSDFSSRIELKVTDRLHGRVSSARIRPWSYNLAFTTEDSGKTVRFFLDRPRKVSVEFNKDVFHNLQVFANPVEVNPPQQGAAGVQYYGPGLHSAGQITLSSNQTLYIAGGALVRAYVRASNATNITIRGRGILDGGEHGQRIIVPTNCSQVTIEGIILTDARQWTIVPTSSDHVTINNIKEICRYGYGDGIDIVSCQQVVIDDVFLRNGDDNISIKARNSEVNTDIVIKNSLFFCDNAHPILIGPEGNGTYTEKVTFINNEILEATMGGAYGGALAVCAGDNMTIRDVTFQDVRIDTFAMGAAGVVNVFIEDNEYTSSPGRAISNITFRNISCRLSRYDPLRIVGYDATRSVNGVLFEDLVINGRTILDTADTPCEFNEFTANIRFTTTGTGIGGRPAMDPPQWTLYRPGPVAIIDLTGRPVRTLTVLQKWGPERWKGIKPGVCFYRAGGPEGQRLGKMVIVPGAGF